MELWIKEILTGLVAIIAALSRVSYTVLKQLIEKDISNLKVDIETIKKEHAGENVLRGDLKIEIVMLKNSIDNLKNELRALKEDENLQNRSLEQILRELKELRK